MTPLQCFGRCLHAEKTSVHFIISLYFHCWNRIMCRDRQMWSWALRVCWEDFCAHCRGCICLLSGPLALLTHFSYKEHHFCIYSWHEATKTLISENDKAELCGLWLDDFYRTCITLLCEFISLWQPTHQLRIFKFSLIHFNCEFNCHAHSLHLVIICTASVCVWKCVCCSGGWYWAPQLLCGLDEI